MASKRLSQPRGSVRVYAGMGCDNDQLSLLRIATHDPTGGAVRFSIPDARTFFAILRASGANWGLAYVNLRSRPTVSALGHDPLTLFR